MAAVETTRSMYEIAGGKETFQQLAAAFYRRVETDALLRPMYPDNLWGHKRSQNASGTQSAGQGLCSPVDALAAFLAQFFGGPPEYSDARGHPRLKMRHVRFHIGQAERDAWLTHMCAAIEEVGIEEPVASVMRQYFDRASTFLINVPEAGS
jgi:hemoglobin